MRKWYSRMRDIHLLSGLFSLAFILMYAASALQFAHAGWVDTKPAVTGWSVRLAPSLEPRDAARALRSAAPVQGDLLQIRRTGELTRFRLSHPGVVHDVIYNPATGQADLKTSRYGFSGMLNRLHTTAGLWHNTAAPNAFGIAVGLVSAALLVLGASGMFLWFTRRNEWKFGTVLMVASLLWAFGAILAMRLA